MVNSVFLYYCTKAGLDLAIVNAEKLERFASIPGRGAPAGREPAVQHAAGRAPDESCGRARGLARSRRREQKVAINQFHIAAIAEHFRKAGKKVKKKAADLPLDQRLANYIIEGTKDGLIADLDLKRAGRRAPLDIINGPLMAGMAEVGRLFNNNELIVAEVLQSAEAMKAAVNHLEQFMEKAETRRAARSCSPRSRATSTTSARTWSRSSSRNNGYKVVNLGIKVPPETADPGLSASTSPDAIGLSGLLVKSAQQMVITAERLARRRHRRAAAGGRRGALGEVHAHARSRRPTASAVCYAKDAMTGLRLMNELMDPADARARSLAAHTSSRGRPRSKRRGEAAARRSRDAPQPQGAHRHSDSRRRRISTARCATCRSSPRSGATSIRSCCTAGISATRAISRRTWRSAIPRRSNSSTRWRR